MMSSVARVKFIKIKAIFRYHTKDVLNQVLSNSDRKIKSYLYSNSSTKMRKSEKWELQNGTIGGLQIGADF